MQWRMVVSEESAVAFADNVEGPRLTHELKFACCGRY